MVSSRCNVVLDLSAVQRVTEAQGGPVRVRSEPAAATTLTSALPISRR